MSLESMGLFATFFKISLRDKCNVMRSVQNFKFRKWMCVCVCVRQSFLFKLLVLMEINIEHTTQLFMVDATFCEVHHSKLLISKLNRIQSFERIGHIFPMIFEMKTTRHFWFLSFTLSYSILFIILVYFVDNVIYLTDEFICFTDLNRL